MWLSTGSVEKRYGVSKYMVRTWRTAGKVRSITTEGGHFRVLEEDVKRILGMEDSPSAY